MTDSTDRTGRTDKTPYPESPAPAAPKPRRRGLFQGIINALVILAAIYVFTPAGEWALGHFVHVDPLRKADYIIVLGGEHSRAAEAVRLYRQGWAPKLVVTSTGDDAATMAAIIVTFGVPPGDVIVDDKARRTADHPATVAAAAGAGTPARPVIIVTSASHTARARAIFVKAGYADVMARPPCWERGGEFAQSSNPMVRARHLPMVAYECVSWCVNWLRGAV